ncbi:integrin alpha-PS5-like [Topomyia yanbarensis]|uniref:integrin alpha-PS5-like n=1 Tax=Topomyia yanbarensis TaxID=2498891 RepID=UPI00273C1E9C|nr:integrin alpha-PS5-like [Topomyia yanbarensis]
MTHRLALVITVLAAVVGERVTTAYNISPVPNVIFSEPAGQVHFPKIRSSYFGLTVHLTRDGILIGAPRAQSSSRRHTTINEPGVLFKCDIRSGFCEQYPALDGGGFESTILKSGQYFGASLDGMRNGEELVACAPRMIKDIDQQYAMTGSCYTRVNGTTRVQRQAFNYQHQSFAFDTALEGFSVHLLRQADDRLEVVTGLPNCNYTGSVMVYSGDLQTGAYLTSEKLEKNGYFGYSVNSMVVQNKTIYLVSAPRYNGEPGKVFLFEKVMTSRLRAEMELHQVLIGDSTKIDYFGYSLCTEDIDGDGLTDVLVGAPFYSGDSINDEGAVFVFVNKGIDDRGVLQLKQYSLLTSKYVGSGQFGYSIISIGDINFDGFNDIAVGAPFEENGSVYIFHGSPGGLQPKPVQILKSSSSSQLPAMFGAAIARGMDVDGNFYNDVAVGAPTEDKVYLFKTYPLIRPIVNMTVSKSFIAINNATTHSDAVDLIKDTCSVEICYFFETFTSFKGHSSYDFRINLTLDATLRRATFQNGSSHFSKIVPISQIQNCINLNISVRASFYQLSSPIRLDLRYEIINQNTAGQIFCDHCVVQDQHPEIKTPIERKIIFKPDCKRDICATDLKLRRTFRNFETPFVLNSSRTMEIAFDIRNCGEPAYGTVLELEFSQNVSFLKKMDFCEVAAAGLNCMINYGQAVREGLTVFVNVTLDSTKLTGNRLEIQGRLFSDGNETIGEDNEILSLIRLIRLSHLETIGSYNPSHINLDVRNSNASVQNRLYILNFGPSNLERTPVHIFIPVGFIGQKSNIIFNSWNVDSLKVSQKEKVIQTSEQMLAKLPKTNTSRLFIETYGSQDRFLLNKKGTTITCETAGIICKNVSILLDDLVVNSEPIRIDINMELFPQSMIQLMTNDVEKLSLYVTFAFDVPAEEILLTNAGSLVLYRNIAAVVPLWIYITSVVLGMAVLTAITYVLYKRQFFKRMTQSDMEDKLDGTEGIPNIAFTDGSVMMIATSSSIGS